MKKIRKGLYELDTPEGIYRILHARHAPSYLPLWHIAPPGADYRFGDSFDTRAEARQAIEQELRGAR